MGNSGKVKPGHAIMTITFHFTCQAQLQDGGPFASHLGTIIIGGNYSNKNLPG